MKKTVIPAIILLLGLIAASACVSSPAGHPAPTTAQVTKGEMPHYTIGIDAAYPPFTYRDSTGNFTGIDIDAARWIAAREGFDVRFVAVPWDGILDALLDGRVDMVYSGMTITPDRQEKVDFSIPYFTVTRSVAVRSGSNVTFADLIAGRLRVGVQAGSTGADWVKRNLVLSGVMPAGQVYLYPDVVSLTGALANGSIDASVSDTPVLEQAIAGRPLEIVGEIPTREQYAVAVRKNDTHLRNMMDAGIRQLMADPHWQELLKQYNLNPLTNFSVEQTLAGHLFWLRLEFSRVPREPGLNH